MQKVTIKTVSGAVIEFYPVNFLSFVSGSLVVNTVVYHNVTDANMTYYKGKSIVSGLTVHRYSFSQFENFQSMVI